MAKKLSKTVCETAKPDPLRDRMIGDGDGLFLRVRPHGTKTWVIEYEFQGSRTKYTIGGYSRNDLPGEGIQEWLRNGQQSLAQARSIAESWKAARRSGHDPVVEWEAFLSRESEGTAAKQVAVETEKVLPIVKEVAESIVVTENNATLLPEAAGVLPPESNENLSPGNRGAAENNVAPLPETTEATPLESNENPPLESSGKPPPRPEKDSNIEQMLEQQAKLESAMKKKFTKPITAMLSELKDATSIAVSRPNKEENSMETGYLLAICVVLVLCIAAMLAYPFLVGRENLLLMMVPTQWMPPQWK